MSNLPDGGAKGIKSARMDLIPFDALWQISLVYGFGATKYADRNWEAGYAWSQSFGALQRHLALFWNGEEVDEESGLPHLAHAGWHCLALLAFAARGLGDDDRTKDREALLKGLETMRAELTNPEIFERFTIPPLRDPNSIPDLYPAAPEDDQVIDRATGR